MFSESSSETREREALIERVARQAKERGVQLDQYVLRVNYSTFPSSGLGHVVDESHLEPQPIYVTAKSWKEAEIEELPPEEVVTIAMEHEFIHEVHRSRARRGLTFRVTTDVVESIIHGVQERPEYVGAKKEHLSPETIAWLQRVNRQARERHFIPLEKLAHSKVPEAKDVYKGIVERINKEVSDQEYLVALGILKGA